MIPIYDVISILILGITIGLIHSTDGDHILALSTLSRDYRKSLKNFWIGISWGLGHSTPLMILGIVILLAKQSILDLYLKISIYMEILVGIMLIFLGIQVFWKIYSGNFHIHTHEHGKKQHAHFHGSHKHKSSLNNDHYANKHWGFPELIPFFQPKSYLIGIVHGLAGSAAIILIILPDTENTILGLFFLFSFSFGTILSMSIIAFTLSFPFSFIKNSNRVKDIFISITGLLSIILGLGLLSDIILKTNLTKFLWY